MFQTTNQLGFLHQFILGCGIFTSNLKVVDELPPIG